MALTCGDVTESATSIDGRQLPCLRSVGSATGRQPHATLDLAFEPELLRTLGPRHAQIMGLASKKMTVLDARATER